MFPCANTQIRASQFQGLSLAFPSELVRSRRCRRFPFLTITEGNQHLIGTSCPVSHKFKKRCWWKLAEGLPKRPHGCQQACHVPTEVLIGHGLFCSYQQAQLEPWKVPEAFWKKSRKQRFQEHHLKHPIGPVMCVGKGVQAFAKICPCLSGHSWGTCAGFRCPR